MTMKTLFRFLLAAALAVGLAVAARYNDGYVLLVVPAYRVELSLNLMILLLLAGFALFYILVRSLTAMWRLPASVQAFRAKQKADKAESALRDAMRYLLEGRYSMALKRAEDGWNAGHAPGLAAVLAARNAQLMRDEPRQQLWLARAAEHDDEIRSARLMMETVMALEGRDFEAARENLEQMVRENGRHIAALRLSLKAYQGLGNWQAVLRVLRVLEKHKAITSDQASVLRRRAHRENLRSLAGDLDALQRYVEGIDPDDLREAGLAAEAVRGLRALGNTADANRIIENALADQWDSALAGLYGEGEGPDALSRISNAEIWLQDHPRDPQLLLTLGRLCLQRDLWGKSRSYLEASLSLQANPVVHLELARLNERLGETESANRHYRAAALKTYSIKD